MLFLHTVNGATAHCRFLVRTRSLIQEQMSTSSIKTVTVLGHDKSCPSDVSICKVLRHLSKAMVFLPTMYRDQVIILQQFRQRHYFHYTEAMVVLCR